MTQRRSRLLGIAAVTLASIITGGSLLRWVAVWLTAMGAARVLRFALYGAGVDAAAGLVSLSVAIVVILQGRRQHGPGRRSP